MLVKEIAFDGYAIKLEDQKPAKPASLSLDQLAFNVKGLSTVSNEPITASLSVRLNEAGTVTVQGTAKLSPPMADVELGRERPRPAPVPAVFERTGAPGRHQRTVQYPISGRPGNPRSAAATHARWV